MGHNNIHSRKQQGVALVQALILSALLALMAVQFTLSSRQQIASAQLFSDRVRAELELRTLKSELLFALFTVTKNDMLSEQWAENSIAKSWNFHGQAFSPRRNTRIRLQDTAGLVNIYLSSGGELLSQFLAASGIPEETARLVQYQLAEWQGKPTNTPGAVQRTQVRDDFLRHKHELSYAAPALANADHITPYLGHLLNVFHNPFLAPEPVLRAYLGEDIVQEIVQRRKNGRLTRHEFTALTQIYEDDSHSFQFSRKLKVELEVTVGNAVAREQALWYIRPQQMLPLAPLQ